MKWFGEAVILVEVTTVICYIQYLCEIFLGNQGIFSNFVFLWIVVFLSLLLLYLSDVGGN